MTSKKITIIGGTGLIGSKLARQLSLAGHQVRAVSPGTGVNSITGQGLAEALQGADVLVDVSNIMSFDAAEIRSFFQTSGQNLVAAAKAAGVSHHVVLSIVGTDRMPGNDYFAGKLLQEQIVASSGLPYTIVRSTQFFEFLALLSDAHTVDGAIALSGTQFQPIAADDVASILATVAIEQPANGVVDIAGPERAPFDRTIQHFLKLRTDARTVRRDPTVKYFGGEMDDFSLVPLAAHRLGRQELNSWVQATAA